MVGKYTIDRHTNIHLVFPNRQVAALGSAEWRQQHQSHFIFDQVLDEAWVDKRILTSRLDPEDPEKRVPYYSELQPGRLIHIFLSHTPGEGAPSRDLEARAEYRRRRGQRDRPPRRRGVARWWVGGGRRKTKRRKTRKKRGGAWRTVSDGDDDTNLETTVEILRQMIREQQRVRISSEAQNVAGHFRVPYEGCVNRVWVVDPAEDDPSIIGLIVPEYYIPYAGQPNRAPCGHGGPYSGEYFHRPIKIELWEEEQPKTSKIGKED